MRKSLSALVALAMLLAPFLSVLGAVADAPDGGASAFEPISGSRGSLNNTDSEPNDEAVEATNVTGNMSIAGAISYSDPSDFYKVSMNNTNWPNRLNASLKFTSNKAGTKAYLTVLDPYEFRLDHVRASAGASAVNSSVAAKFIGYYYIGVLWDIQNEATATVSYTLNLTLLNITFTTDGNDRKAGAITLTDGLSRTDGLDELTDAADFYVANLTHTSAMSDVLYMMLKPAVTLDLTIEIYTSAGLFMRQVNDGGEGSPEVLYLVSPATDDYYFRLWANTGAGAYGLEVREGIGVLDNNNDLPNATAVQAEADMFGNVTDDYDPDDFFGMNLTLGEEITANLTILGHNATLGLPVLNLWLYNASSFVKNSTSNNLASKQVWYEADVPGWYYIRVGASDMSFGNYKLLVTVVSPPKILPHSGTLTMDEDQTKVLDLGTIFSDPQAKPLMFAVSGNSSLRVVLDGENATINSTGPNWFGSEKLTFSATNELGKTAYVDINVVVAPINDAPVALQEAFTQGMDEDTTWRLTTTFMETKFSDVDGDGLDFSFVPDANFTFTKDVDAITLAPKKDWNGHANLTLVAKDPGGLNASTILDLTVRPIQDAPVVISPIPDINMSEDGNTTLDLTAYFSDPDGEALSFDGYSEEGQGGVRHVMVSMNGSVATITLAQDWYGTENVTFTAKDGYNATATIEARIIVKAVNDGPRVNPTYWIMYTQETWILEDKVGNFDLSKLFTDPDGDKLTFKALGAGSHLNTMVNGNFLVVTPASDWFGVEKVNLSAEDPAGLKVMVDLPVTVVNENDRPILTAGGLTPKKGEEKTSFKFSITVKDVDGDDPIVSVVIDGTDYRMQKESGDIRTGAVYGYSTKLKGGDHTYSFKADDNTHTATSIASLDGANIDVKKPVDTTVYVFYAIIIIVIVILLILTWAAMNRAQRMREFDDSWDEDEEEEEIPAEDE